MSKPLEGVRVLEVAAWTFVPAGGAILADLGAEVIKVEPPTGDPQRGLKNMLNLSKDGPNPFNEVPNRGKRSITIDLAKPEGRDVLLKIAAVSDVFLTSYLPEVRKKLRLDVEDLRAANPTIIYARGSGWGSKGPMKDTGGYDLASSWATSGFAQRLVDSIGEGAEPPPQPPAFYDLQGGNTLAGAISTALFKRERTGEPSIVDVSLMSVGMWSMCPDLVSAPYMPPMIAKRNDPGNPLANWYKTSDGRWIYLVLLQADRFWGELCHVMQRPDLIDDERFKDMVVRYQNREACVATLDAIFATASLEEWKQRLEKFSGVWAPVIDVKEVHQHPQIEPNGYLPTLTDNDGVTFKIVASPMSFDDEPTVPQGAAPELGQDTEMILLEAGLDWDAITAVRETGALG